MSQLQEEFAQSAAKLIQKAAELGYSVTLGEAWRTPEQAQWDADHGIGIVHSLHMERLAIDLNLFKDGQYLTTPESYTQLGEWWQTLGGAYRWGGNFTSKDYNHYSISPDGLRG
jgi:D-alanyl-D-alanine carboxypeptidase